MVMTRVRMLHFGVHNAYYKDTIQARSVILISFCFQFTGVQVCQKLSKQTLV